MKHRLAPLLEGMEMGKSEHDWLEQRLESMTAKEELLFRGAMQIESPRDIQTTIQILQGLDHYQLLYGAEDDVLLTVPAFAAGGDVAGAVEQTWDDAEYSARDCAPQPLKLSIHSGGIEHPCRCR